MFDNLLNEVAARFGLSLDKAKLLLGSLIALIFNEKRGGAAGFVDLFRSRGLSGMMDSWIGDGPNDPIDASQLELALGGQDIDAIARQSGVERGVAASALAALLPGTFNTLTDDGRIPTTIPDRIRGFMDDMGDFFRNAGAGALGLGAAAVGGVARAVDRTGDAMGDAAENTVDAIGDAGRATVRTVDNAADRVGDAARSDGIGKWLPWLLLAGLLIAALFWFKGCSKNEMTPAPTPTPAATETTTDTAATSANQQFGFANAGGKVTVNGQVASDANKTRLWDALLANFGDGNVNGDIVVDANTAPAGWLDKLVALLPDFKANGLKFNFDGSKLQFDTSAMSDADRNALMEKLNGAFDGVQILGLDKGADALAALGEGFAGSDLVKALSMMNIQFKTGSAEISPASMVLVRNAAEYIKKAPAGTRIEVGGHTDNVGNAASNLTLSDARANAVMAKLTEFGVTAGTLTAKGYGQEKPLADNGTDAGKAQNRRIEYTLAQ